MRTHAPRALAYADVSCRLLDAALLDLYVDWLSAPSQPAAPSDKAPQREAGPLKREARLQSVGGAQLLQTSFPDSGACQV
ncbi:hypothetical protein GCM10022403_023410 [Streptomyces coacervatus]|uniref:Uncharacterized protein n=1 Tax=Streptomyces coacervatus TaxID=647381 RepID=A0ABP7H9Y2_9ACTN